MSTSLQRIGALLRARLSAGPKGGLPVAAFLAQALVAALLCGLVSDALPPFAYGVFAYSLTTMFLAIPLLGELGWLLRSDEAAEWAETLPVRAFELRLARTLHLLLILWALTLASQLPAAVLAPDAIEGWTRLYLPLGGLGAATLLAAGLLLVQAVLGGRAESLLVLFQTMLVVAVVVGLVLGIRHIPTLARLPHLGDTGADYLYAFPPAWFAAPLAIMEGEPARLWLPLLLFGAALLILAVTPSPKAPRYAGGETLLVGFCAPFRYVATRLWLRRDERGAFDLVYDALPKEREVVLRTYPMVGIPLALQMATLAGGASKSDLYALLLFTPGIYLPILMMHVPASASHRARWLLEGAPVSAGAVAAGAIKALAVRFLLPLYFLLGFMAWREMGWLYCLRVALPGLLASLWVMRKLYFVCVDRPPLSTAPDELHADLDWFGVMGGLALALTLLAVVANRMLVTWVGGLGLAAALLALELFAEWRRPEPATAAAGQADSAGAVQEGP